MSSVAPSLEIEVVWNDPDIQEVAIKASSGLFSGQVRLYANWNELKEISKQLRGFPRTQDDRRQFKLGQENLAGYGIATLSLYCTDARGHVAIEVALKTNPENRREGKESAVVLIPAVVGDIDRFADDLRTINNQIGARAVLQSAA
jgi:hypothetical protein